MTLLRHRLVLLLVAAVVLAGCATDVAAAPVTGPCGRSGLTAGTHVLRYGGVDRPYLLSLPAGYGRRPAYPLVLAFHGHGGNKEKTEANTRLGRVGADAGYLVVTPDATGSPSRWNYDGQSGQPDDYGFVHALVTEVRARLCVDPRRIFAAGHSNGAAFASQLVCRAPYEFAAVAMVSATVPAACPAGVAPAVLAIHGTADATVPYLGVAGKVPAATATAAYYASRYRCPATPRHTSVAPGVDQLRYTGCVAGAEVVLDTIAGGTHPWPGSSKAAADLRNSTAGQTFDATGAILAFFRGHHR